MVPSQNFYNVLASFLSVPVSVDSSRVLNFIGEYFKVIFKSLFCFLIWILDFTRNGFVTPYEFNLFLRWFGPLPGSVKRILYLLDNG